MIVSFGDKATEALFHGQPGHLFRRFPPTVITAALRKLDTLNAASQLNELRSPPGNRLEPLRGTLEGFYSIRVNDQWRLIFRWEGKDAHAVRLTDYH
jgi:proteic killer suppression protein